MVVTFALHGILVIVQEVCQCRVQGMEITRPLTTRPMLELDRTGQDLLLRWDLARQMEFHR